MKARSSNILAANLWHVTLPMILWLIDACPSGVLRGKVDVLWRVVLVKPGRETCHLNDRAYITTWKYGKLRWCGHMLRMDEGNKATQKMKMKVRGTRAKWRPRMSWMYNIMQTGYEYVWCWEGRRPRWKNMAPNPGIVAEQWRRRSVCSCQWSLTCSGQHASWSWWPAVPCRSPWLAAVLTVGTDTPLASPSPYIA